MKKLTLTLALILCLVLCVFAFASCGKEKKPATTTGKASGTDCAHVWGEYVEEVAATCKTPGMKVRYCTKCQAADPETQEIPKLAHTESTDYKIILEPTCRDAGYKTKYCTKCFANIDSTGEDIPSDPEKHVYGTWEVTVEPTLTTDGERHATCTLCSEPKTEVYPLPVYNSKAFDGPYASGNSIVFSKTVGEISGADKTFHPTDANPDGNDLWFEYSFLWNDTLLNWDQSKSEMSLAAFKNEKGSYRHFYYLYTNDGQSTDCPYKGHFDYSTYLQGYEKGQEWECAQELGNGQPRYKAGWSGGRGDSPFIYDSESQTVGGWHRIGVRFHQEVTVDNGKGGIVYSGYTELYVDGVKVWKVLTDMQGYWKNSKWEQLNGYGGKGKADLKHNDLLLWYAKTELDEEDVPEEWTLHNGLYYKDHDDMIVYGSLDKFANSTNAAYASFYDVIWTCGNGFVRNVTPVASPEGRTITLYDNGTPDDTADDVTCSGAIFYQES